MKPVTYMDKKGYKKKSLIRDRDNESDAPFGIPAGVPDINSLDWEEIKKNLNNYLFDVGIFTANDVAIHQHAITNAVLACVRRPLLLLYREKGK